MAINWTEAQIEQIVASVMKGLKGEAPATTGEYDGAGYNGKAYIGVFTDMNDAIDAAEQGYKAIRAMSLEDREKIIEEYNGRLKMAQKEHEIESLLIGSGARNIRAVRALITSEDADGVMTFRRK